jgi:hypothetical protein
MAASGCIACVRGRESGSSPFRESLDQTSGAASALAQDLHRTVGVHAVRSPTIRDVLLVSRKLAEPPLQFIDGDRNRTRDVPRLVFARRACVENHDVIRPGLLKELVHPHWRRVRTVTEVLVHEAFKVCEPSLSHTADGDAQFEYCGLGEPVQHEEAVFAALDQGCLTQGLEVLRRVRERQACLEREGIDPSFALRQELQDLESMRAAEGLPDPSVLRVHAILEMPVSVNHRQVINRLLE